jgi:hypothetical protein
MFVNALIGNREIRRRRENRRNTPVCEFIGEANGERDQVFRAADQAEQRNLTGDV